MRICKNCLMSSDKLSHHPQKYIGIPYSGFPFLHITSHYTNRLHFYNLPFIRKIIFLSTYHPSSTKKYLGNFYVSPFAIVKTFKKNLQRNIDFLFLSI